MCIRGCFFVYKRKIYQQIMGGGRMMKKFFIIIGCVLLIIGFVWNEGLPHVSPGPQAPVVEEVEKPDYIVYITGAVRKPGLYSFTHAVTVGDAVHAAGDALPYAEASAVNYASRIEDGMQIHLPYNLDGVPVFPASAPPWQNTSSSTGMNTEDLPSVSSCSRSKALVLPSMKS